MRVKEQAGEYKVNVASPKFMTAARTKMMRLMPLAMAEKWTCERLAKESGCSVSAASRLLLSHRASVVRMAEEQIHKPVHRLVKVAQKSREAAIAALERLEKLTEMSLKHVEASAPKDGKPGVPLALDEFGLPLPFDVKTFAGNVATAGKAARDLLKFSDEITGVDVVKQITIRTQSDKEGKLVSWDGVESLESAHEAGIIRDEPLQLSDSDSSDDWLE